MLFFSFLCFLVFNACLEDDNSPDTSVRSYFPGVDEELWPYFSKFENEGNKRGFSIDLARSGITANIREIHNTGVAGQCSYGGNLPTSQITIDEGFWKSSNVLGKEFVVFHELGHCNLFRGHLEDSLNNGSCVSIMRSGLGSCRDVYTNETRSYYLDELFFNRE
jgi:hypothetical protein